MTVGSWQFFALDLGLVIAIVILCKLWDKYDQYKIRKLTEKSKSIYSTK